MTKFQDSIEETSQTNGSFLDLFRTVGNRRALLLACGCVTFQQLSGINVVLFYTQMIFEMAGKSSLGPSESTIIVGVILLAAAAAAVPLTHCYGIKTMLLISALGMSFFLVSLAGYSLKCLKLKKYINFWFSLKFPKWMTGYLGFVAFQCCAKISN